MGAGLAGGKWPLNWPSPQLPCSGGMAPILWHASHCGKGQEYVMKARLRTKIAAKPYKL
jgi:hypothetical protein